MLAFQNYASCILGGLNDCAECKGGYLTGACLPDKQPTCQSATLPWNVVCKNVYATAPDKNRVWEVAGQSGCDDCGSFASFIQENCATTCNYCGISGILLCFHDFPQQQGIVAH